MNRISKIFQPVTTVPKNAIVKNQGTTSRSQKLMLDLGLIKPTGSGTFHILPLAQRSVEKCVRLIDFYMKKVDAQKMSIPVLTSADLWKKSGRFTATTTTELLTTRDRHEKLQILGPTFEEAITALLATLAPLSYRQFPLRLYQIGSKFRDEHKPRFGLMRSKEFLMKDCYSFDVDRVAALETYRQLNDAYRRIFSAIGVPFLEVQADTGNMGGSLSHEYQYSAAVGEDVLVKCTACNYSSNIEMCSTAATCECPACKQITLQKSQGIEVAHTFLLDEKYTKVLGATYLPTNGKPAPLVMGCYGIGVTRLIAAALECLSEEREMRWPFLLAPYSVCIIPPKDGSKEQAAVQDYTDKIYGQLIGIDGLADEVVVDDRYNLTIGKRLMEAKRLGYPIVIVIGPKAADKSNALFEFHLTNAGSTVELQLSDIIQETGNVFRKYSYR